MGRGPVLGPFVGAKPLQGDLEERGSEPLVIPTLPRAGAPSTHPCGGVGEAPVVVAPSARCGHVLSTAWLLCHCSSLHRHAGQLGTSCCWRWISPSWLPPAFLPSPFLQPLLLCRRCDLGAGSGTMGGWELCFLAAFNRQPVLLGAPAWSGFSPSLSLPTS